MPHHRYRDAGGGNGQVEHGDALNPWSGTGLVTGNARARHQRDQVRLIAPGWARTDLGGPDAPLSVDESIPKVVDVLLAQLGKPGLRYLDR
jgi:hypothetical protein